MGFWTPQNIEFANYADKIKFLLVWRLTIAFIFVLLALTGIYYFESTDAFYTYVIGTCIGIGGFVFLRSVQKYKPVFLFYAVAGTIVVNADLNMVIDSPHYGNFLWLSIVIILAFFGLGPKWGFTFLTINALALIYFLFTGLEKHYEVMSTVSNESVVAVSIEVAFCLFLIGYLINNFIKVHSFAEYELVDKNLKLKEQNETIVKSNKEKTILVKEIHHRVKNNLQIIISLLRLQMSDLKNAESKQHFSEAINRVMVMSSIHAKLYQEKDITNFNLANYINELAIELKNFFLEEFPVEIKIESDYENIDLKTVVPVGLILNELLSNSFKYAFTENDEGLIDIKIKDHKDSFELNYSDSGIWKSPETDNTGFGIELIQVLTEQLNGTKKMYSNGSGTHYEFKFNKLQP